MSIVLNGFGGTCLVTRGYGCLGVAPAVEPICILSFGSYTTEAISLFTYIELGTLHYSQIVDSLFTESFMCTTFILESYVPIEILLDSSILNTLIFLDSIISESVVLTSQIC